MEATERWARFPWRQPEPPARDWAADWGLGCPLAGDETRGKERKATGTQGTGAATRPPRGADSGFPVGSCFSSRSGFRISSRILLLLEEQIQDF